MEYVNKVRDQLNKKLKEKNPVTDCLNKVQEKTGVKAEYVIYGVCAFIVLWLMVGWGATLLANFIGFLYPAYASIKAIESTCKEDDTKWLTYWVVYAAFGLVETFTDIFLYWIPFYALDKCILLVYLMVPGKYNGSILLYNRFIRPYILKYENDIDKAADEVGKFVEKGMFARVIIFLQFNAVTVDTAIYRKVFNSALPSYENPKSDAAASFARNVVSDHQE